ncbi:MAG: hypothetical protein ACLFNI_02960 [Natronomonas sp.]
MNISESTLMVVLHYIAMLIAIFLVLIAIRAAFESVNFWIELVIVIVIAFAYRPFVVWLGIAPKPWNPD